MSFHLYVVSPMSTQEAVHPEETKRSFTASTAPHCILTPSHRHPHINERQATRRTRTTDGCLSPQQQLSPYTQPKQPIQPNHTVTHSLSRHLDSESRGGR